MTLPTCQRARNPGSSQQRCFKHEVGGADKAAVRTSRPRPSSLPRWTRLLPLMPLLFWGPPAVSSVSGRCVLDFRVRPSPLTGGTEIVEDND
jgi:hypothetical protein